VGVPVGAMCKCLGLHGGLPGANAGRGRSRSKSERGVLQMFLTVGDVRSAGDP